MDGISRQVHARGAAPVAGAPPPAQPSATVHGGSVNDEEDGMSGKRNLIDMLAVAGAILSFTLPSSVEATPAAGFSAETLYSGVFDEIHVNNHSQLPDAIREQYGSRVWVSVQKTEGPSTLFVQSNKWDPGGTTGWHTHPGHSLIIVTEGTITAYDGDDPSCRPHVYTKGMSFVDQGGGHVHVLRNEGAGQARTVAVQLIPLGANRRSDAPKPAACPR